MAQNYYCDSIDIAGSAIAILLLLWTTITILLGYNCLKYLRKEIKIMIGLICMYGYQFCIEPTEKYQNVVKVSKGAKIRN